MNEPIWNGVDAFVNKSLGLTDDALASAQRACDEARLPEIQVEPSLGKMLEILARSVDASRILEIGTLGGVSTIALARGLSDGGRVITLELDAHHAEVARGNLERAGVDDSVEILVGPAIDSLSALEARGTDPFDLVFIDADKQNIPAYFDWSVRHTRPGGLVMIDNVVRDGKIADDSSDDERVVAIRKTLGRIAADPRIEATIVQTVSSKGYDGFLLATVAR